MASMARPQFNIPVFQPGQSVEETLHILRSALRGLQLANVAWLRFNAGKVPPLYQSGVRYLGEESDEQWLTIPYVYAARAGDCEDLAAWRAAELNTQGVNAFVDVLVRRIDGTWRGHAVVRLPNGKIEDPAAKLGMPASGGV